MKSAKERRTILPAVSEQMKAWASALANEVASWPKVSAKSFFGFTALYCKDRMFAALPRTRAMATPNSLVFKIENPPARVHAKLQSNPCIGLMNMRKARWYTLELSSDADLHDALDWLSRAYQAASQAQCKDGKRH